MFRVHSLSLRGATRRSYRAQRHLPFQANVSGESFVFEWWSLLLIERMAEYNSQNILMFLSGHDQPSPGRLWPTGTAWPSI